MGRNIRIPGWGFLFLCVLYVHCCVNLSVVSVSRVESAASTMFHLLTTLLTMFPKCTVNSIKMFLQRRPGFSLSLLSHLLAVPASDNSLGTVDERAFKVGMVEALKGQTIASAPRTYPQTRHGLVLKSLCITWGMSLCFTERYSSLILIFDI